MKWMIQPNSSVGAARVFGVTRATSSIRVIAEHLPIWRFFDLGLNGQFISKN